MLTLTPTTMLVWALAALLGFVLVALWYRYDEKKEDRNRARIQLAGVLQEAGLKHMAEIIIDLAVRDWDGLYRHLKALTARTSEPGQLLEMLKENFQWQLTKRLEKPEELASIATAVGKAQAAKRKKDS